MAKDKIVQGGIKLEAKTNLFLIIDQTDVLENDNEAKRVLAGECFWVTTQDRADDFIKKDWAKIAE
jgi:hypothetical protein